MGLTVPHVQQVQRVRIARDMARDDRAVLRRALDHAAPFGSRATEELEAALADLEAVVEHLDRALRLTDPTSREPLVRRADEDRTAIGS